jgi:hypothetical protein
MYDVTLKHLKWPARSMGELVGPRPEVEVKVAQQRSRFVVDLMMFKE